MAVASGAKGAEAVVVLTDGDAGRRRPRRVRDFAGSGVPVHRGSHAGEVQDTQLT